ncbi:Wall-associated receptor kinase [Theobroma cacao]|nr:Wall-associated receptor kinase [Theobroma cacao]
MPKPKAQLPWFGLMAVLSSFLLPEACIARSTNKDCGFTLCGDVNISFPFRLTSQPRKCGNHRLELECDNNNRTTLVMKHGRFYVRSISYGNQTIQVIDPNLSKNDCSIPRSSFIFGDSCKQPYWVSRSSIMYLVNCTTPIKSSQYVDASRCPNRSSHPPTYFYFLDKGTRWRDFNQFCTVATQVPIGLENISNMSTLDIFEKLLQGFELSWEGFNWDCSYRRSYDGIPAAKRNRANSLTMEKLWWLNILKV